MKNRTWRLALVAAALLAAMGARGASIEDDFAEAGALHRNGETAAAIAIWQYWAERGDADAAYNLAVIHHYGDGVPRDDAQALAWYRIAAGLGDRLSYYLVGLLDPNSHAAATQAGAAHGGHGPSAHEAHHGDDPQSQAWREEAARLIREDEWREALEAARKRDEQVVAELRRRAGLPEATSPEEAGGSDPAVH